MKKLREKGAAAAAVGLAFCCLFAAEQNAARADSRRVLRMSDMQSVHSSAEGRKGYGPDAAGREERCVVIDAGHGGADPGKVGINGALEQDINLQVARLVKQYLELEDVRVVMTREDGEGLYDPDAPNKKVQDMKRRIAVIDETNPDVTVSIHQNSYPEEYVHGAQVFFYTNSTEGQKLAEILQSSLVRRTDSDNHRQAKGNDSYYLLKKTAVPIVIVECGFLSNGREAELLSSEAYQEKVAWAIHLGILQYLSGSGD